MTIQTSINFGGFYNSIHESQIDAFIEFYYQDEFNYLDPGEYPSFNYENIDYKKTFNSYIKDYCIEFESYILNQYEIDINFKNIKLNSPKEYNFKTDTIGCNINEIENKKLIETFKNDLDFLNYLENSTTSSDGFISFYTFEQALNDKDNVLSIYLLEYLSNEFNDTQELPYEFEIHLIND